VTAGHVDGLLNQMTQAGMLRDVVGVVVGGLLRCDWRRERPEMPQTLSIEDVLEQYLTPLGSPCSTGCRWATASI
jgi:muramoyltetrapeptide carboxypeptidase LdcA involved in peptidoglycan recycling